jgi:type II secretory pathway pseudopilin PulG
MAGPSGRLGAWFGRILMEANVDPTLLIVIVVLVALVLIGVWMQSGRSRREKLQSRFGSEYDRAIEEAGSRKEAERELAAREKRVQAFDMRTLTPDEQHEFSQRWRAAQARFVDDPAQAIADANGLVDEVMRARGYPMGDFEQRAADLSVDHADVVSNYRAARELVLKNEQKLASTEDLRQAMVHFRSLFDDLLGAPEAEARKELVR